MTKTASEILKTAYFRGLERVGYSDYELAKDLKELEAIHQQEIAKARIDGKRQGLNFSKSFIIPTLQSMKLNRKQISTIETLFSDASTSINEDRKQELEKL